MTIADPVLKHSVWDRYRRDAPKPGTDFNRWAKAFSEETEGEVSVQQIKRVVAEGVSAYLNDAAEKRQTHAQEVADLIGASLVAACETLAEGFKATKKRLLTDAKGRPKLINEDGPMTSDNMIWVEVEDWPSRLSAVRTAIEIHGARAPQQFQVDSRALVVEVTAADALKELERIAETIPRLQRAASRVAARTPRAIGAGAGVEGDDRAEGRLLLVDGVYEDA